MRRAAAFLEAVKRSRSLHGRWVQPPATLDQYRAFLQRFRRPTHLSHFLEAEDGSLVGVINISEIVRGAFCSGYLGYYAFAPHQGRGHLRAGLDAVVRLAFRRYALHRLEANIQPENLRSIALVRSLGFRKEGYSPRYLKIAGRWRDHERWALTAEDWRTQHGQA
jgi:ribosomal-protein-alanine N-acetyltransferase